MSTLAQRLGALEQRAIPAALRDAEDDRARVANLIFNFVLIICGAASAYAAFYVVLGMMFTAMGTGIAVVVSLVALGVMRRTENTVLAGHIVAASAFTALAAITIGTGSLHSVALGWFVIVPMTASMVVSRWAGAKWLLACVGYLTALYLLDGQPFVPPSELPEFFDAAYKFIVPIGMVAVMFAIAWVYEVGRDRAMQEIREAGEQVEHALGEAEQAHTAARRVLDNVAEGMAIVQLDGALGAERSASFDSWFGPVAGDASLWDVLAQHDPEFAGWLELGWDELESDWMPLELAIEQLPHELELGGMHLSFAYQPLHGGESLDGILVVVSDITAQLEAEQAEESQRELMSLFGRYLRDAKSVRDFVGEASELVDAIATGESTQAEDARWIHTLKGNCGIFGLTSMARWLHGLEDILAEEHRGCSGEERTALAARWAEQLERMALILEDDSEQTITVSRSAYEDAMGLAMRGVPGQQLAELLRTWTWSQVAHRLDLLGDRAEDLAERLGKPNIQVVVEGEGLSHQPSPEWRSFWSALVHVVRNAIDHGIESPDDREALEKRRAGRLTLGASVTGEHFEVQISDDGAGIDWGAVARRAEDMGLPFETQEDLVSSLFAHGLTTRREVTEVSGRGVGMSAVREACEELGGAIRVSSAPGAGSTFTFVFSATHVQSTHIQDFEDVDARV